MKNTLLYILFVMLLSNIAFSQGEEIGPLMANPHLNDGSGNQQAKLNEGTFDSTFVYISDTIDLPVFDDFSSSKFQTYSAGYTDLGVTSDKKFRLLDNSTLIPLPEGVLYTEQQTFTRVFDVANGTATDTPLPSIQIKVGDLSTYPVVYSTVEVYPPYYVYDTIDYVNDLDTIWILDAEIFQDSATQFFAPISDPDLIWLDDEAYHNYTQAVNPWSLGVVTFDGLDSKGYPYAIGTTTSGIADHLTSKKIKMSTTSSADSVYLSFLFQPQGYGDAPEPGDSLFLEFYEEGTMQWNRIWSGGGTGLTDFQVGHVLVDSAIYFNDGFQIRFKNFGALSGSLDHYHLDYVALRAFSGYQDTLFKDFAMVYPVNTLLEDYTSVPWDHYQNNFSGKMSDSVIVVVRNGSNIPENNSLSGTVESFYSGASEGSFSMLGGELTNGDLNYAPRTTYLSYHDFSSGYRFDETKLGPSEVFDIVVDVPSQFPNPTFNDTAYSQQVFANYYAYDDGSAEAAYGVTGAQSRLAIQYTPYEADSVIGAMINFVPSVVDVSNKLFLLTMWDDNNGEPGAVIYEDDVFFPRQPEYRHDRDIFTYYFFEDTAKMSVTGTFYIGWRQLDADRLNVGMDMNIPNANKTFYSVDNGFSWGQSSFDASVMIRPIFSTGMDASLGIEEKKKEEVSSLIYPNPTNDIVTIKTSLLNYDGVEVYDLKGNLVISSENKVVNMSAFESGIYLFRIKGDPKIYKVIKH